jgi:hypothetical protein
MKEVSMSRILFVSAPLALFACAHNPATGRSGTGAPLKVASESGTYQYEANVETGGSVTTHADGSESSTVQYETQTLTGSFLDWKLYEGDYEVDEQDWYRLAGDLDAADKVASQRRTYKRLQDWGAIATVAGIAGAVALYALAPKDEDGVVDPAYTWGSQLVGYTVGLGGACAWIWGYRKLNDTSPKMPLDRAEADADVICRNGICREQLRSRR